MTTYLLDTNICIYIIKNKPIHIAQKVASIPKSDHIAMSYITYAELLFGTYKSSKPQQAIARLEALTQVVPVLCPDKMLIPHYAEQRHILERSGKMIGANDLWIAAHALSLKAILVSNDTEFQRIDGLLLENWAEHNESKEE
ncbi:type II toxin-antitoxin system VapC family toxin [Rodentibacter abscessus]|uniref:type II toxin-antitoxin system VapC family toxin n=1 Tax=Rodentibacter abscessus TaxID=3381777 RepID=UPI00399D19E7